jgi:hypothetical protein
MIIKIDMDNAFDRAKHNFLLVFLAKFGFTPPSSVGFHLDFITLG